MVSWRLGLLAAVALMFVVEFVSVGDRSYAPTPDASPEAEPPTPIATPPTPEQAQRAPQPAPAPDHGATPLEEPGHQPESAAETQSQLPDKERSERPKPPGPRRVQRSEDVATFEVQARIDEDFPAIEEVAP